MRGRGTESLTCLQGWTRYVDYAAESDLSEAYAGEGRLHF